MKQIVFIALIVISPLTFASEINYKQDLKSYINDIYIFRDNTIIHNEINNSIKDSFFDLLNNYNSFSQEDLDSKALNYFKMLYTTVNLGIVEDSIDLRRQSFRAAQNFSAIALCSEYNSHYYVQLATQNYLDKHENIIEFMKEEFIGQVLVNVYIGILKNDYSLCAKYINLGLKLLTYKEFEEMNKLDIYEFLVKIEKKYNFNKK